MRFLLRFLSYEKDATSSERLLKDIAKSIGGKAVNTKRTSYGALEVDVFLPSKQDFELFMAAIEPLGKVEFSKDLQEPERYLAPPEAVAKAVALFDGERYWEAHELLEAVWRTATGSEKRLLQGLILVCAALVHEQKGESSVAIGIVKRALPLLDYGEPEYLGVRLGPLRKRLEKSVSEGRLPPFQL